MKMSFYKNNTNSFFKGKRCISLCELKNGLGSVPAGTKLTIRDKWNGFDVISDKCPHCGIEFLISKVNPLYIELLKEGE